MGLLLRSERYFPRGLGLKAEVKGTLSEDYHSAIIARIREQGFQLEAAGMTIRLAREFGFCYGVDRAVEYAYEACQKFPDRRIFLANQIIHNPHVNEKLRKMGVTILSAECPIDIKLKGIKREDVVLISAFGATVEEMHALHEIGCILVDTTCGSVMSVWKSVEKYAREGLTSIVHGKWDHEETKATCSRVTQYPGAHFLIVRDLEEADFLCEFIRNSGEPEAFFQRFAKACSPGFDPDRHLQSFGVANQTTMLSGESMEIARRVRTALAARFGEEEATKRFQTFDTICSATQDRQDAVKDLLRNPLDLMIVIGGYNSSNTTHLAEIATTKIPAFHIQDASGLVSAREIHHKPVGAATETIAKDWLPARPLTIGVTAGASTPNSKIGEVIERLIELRERQTEERPR